MKENIEKKQQRNAMIDENNSENYIQFVYPLLEDGYPPAVLEYEQSKTFMGNNGQHK